MVFFSDKITEQKTTPDHSDQSEHGQEYFTKAAPEFPSPGHALILNKMQLEPIAYYPMFFARKEIQFDIEFQCLICYDHRQNNKDYISCFHALLNLGWQI